MRLDQIGFGRSLGFDGIGINSALAKNPLAVEVVLAFENPLLHLDEIMPDDVALLLGVGYALECTKKLLARIGDGECVAGTDQGFPHRRKPVPTVAAISRTNSVSPSRIRPVST